IVAPANCNLRGAPGHQLFARRSGTGISIHTGECGTHLRSQLRQPVVARGRWLPRGCNAWRFAPAWVEQWRSGALYRPLPNHPLARATESRKPVQVADLRTDPSYLEGDPLPVSAVEIANIRTLLVVPMFKENEVVGAIAIYRQEVRPFTDKQIDLVK